MFPQQSLIDGNKIRFVHDGSDQAPKYTIFANDGVLNSQPSESIIKFKKDETNIFLNPKVISAVCSGIIGLIFLVIKIYLNRKAAQNLKKLTEGLEEGIVKQQVEFQKNVIRPIFQAMYEQINMKGCLGYTDDATMKRYLKAVTYIIERLDANGVDVDFSQMRAVKQSRIINAIVEKTKE